MRRGRGTLFLRRYTRNPFAPLERMFPDNRQVILQDLMYETPTTEPEGKKRRFSLVDIRPRSKVILTHDQKKKRRSAPSVFGLGWFNKTSSSLQENDRPASSLFLLHLLFARSFSQCNLPREDTALFSNTIILQLSQRTSRSGAHGSRALPPNIRLLLGMSSLQFCTLSLPRFL